MVTATVVKDSSGFKEFSCNGHAGYLKKGRDIVCSAISALTINTANSIMTLTDTPIDVDEYDGFLSWKFEKTPDEKAALLMDSLILGLKSVAEEYKGYLTLRVEEV